METIGFIGLGLMGRPMAEHILQVGYPLVVHNRSRGTVDALAAQGGTRHIRRVRSRKSAMW